MAAKILDGRLPERNCKRKRCKEHLDMVSDLSPRLLTTEVTGEHRGKRLDSTLLFALWLANLGWQFRPRWILDPRKDYCA